jgi:penicillin-binding protein 1A
MAYCEKDDCGYKGIVSTLTFENEKYFCPRCKEQIHVTDYASDTVYSWFVDTVLDDVATDLAAKDGRIWDEMGKQERELYRQLIQRGGYHIYTTLDMEVQEQVDKIYMDLTQIPETRGGQQLQSGIIVIDNRTGDIVAMAGGVGEKVVFDAFNMATDAQRQIGSSIKPLSVYAPAFEVGGFSPATVIKDLPLRYNEDEEGEITPFPRNAERYYSYSTTIKTGIMQSVNAVAVNTLDMIGTRYSYNFAKNMFKVSGLLEAGRNGTTDIDYSPLALGGLTNGASVRDMASAYATFANKGTYREGRTYTKVYDSQGNLIIDNTQDSELILSQKTVDYMNYCLDQAVQGGTGTMAKIDGINVCGKTGTTNSRMDRYFCGYTGYYTAAVWCGFETPAEIVLVGDTRHPAGRLWQKVMAPLHEGKENIPLYDEENMVKITVCLDSGKLATDACMSDIRGTARTEEVLVYEEDVPMGYCDKHFSMDYCTEGDAVANEYCHKFATVGMLKLEQRALVKMTQAMIDELALAEEFNLLSVYLQDNYIYQVDDAGLSVPFHGIHGDINLEGTDSCLTCTVHTQESWEQYKAEHPWLDNPGIQDPDQGDGDDTGDTGDTGEDNWWEDLWPITTEGEEE